MKTLKLTLLTALIAFAPVQSSQGAVSAVMAIFGSPAAGGVALAALGSVGVGYLGTVTARSCDGGTCLAAFALGAAAGIILLDEEGGNVKFEAIEDFEAKALGLTQKEAGIYNSEVEEVNMLFQEVKSNLTGESSIKDAKAVWEDYKELVSEETFKAMKVIAQEK